MIKSIKALLLVVILATTDCLVADFRGAVEIRSSAFYHSSKQFRDIYNDVGPTYAVEISGGFCNCFEGWVDLDLFPKDTSHGSCCKSKIRILNTSFGINYIFPISCCLDAYLGIGPSFSWVQLRETSYCERENTCRCAFGGILKSGLRYQFCGPWFADLFVDYLYQPLDIGRTIDIGGVKMGIGLGTKF